MGRRVAEDRTGARHCDTNLTMNTCILLGVLDQAADGDVLPLPDGERDDAITDDGPMHDGPTRSLADKVIGRQAGG